MPGQTKEHIPKMVVISERNKRLESILGGLTSGTLELNPLEQDINIIKSDIEALGYEVTYELGDKKKGMYHLHIRKKMPMKLQSNEVILREQNA